MGTDLQTPATSSRGSTSPKFTSATGKEEEDQQDRGGSSKPGAFGC